MSKISSSNDCNWQEICSPYNGFTYVCLPHIRFDRRPFITFVVESCWLTEKYRQCQHCEFILAFLRIGHNHSGVCVNYKNTFSGSFYCKKFQFSIHSWNQTQRTNCNISSKILYVSWWIYTRNNKLTARFIELFTINLNIVFKHLKVKQFENI